MSDERSTHGEMSIAADLVGERTPERAVRLLRAKAAELEVIVKLDAITPTTDLAADIALIAHLLADHIEQADKERIREEFLATPATADAVKEAYDKALEELE